MLKDVLLKELQEITLEAEEYEELKEELADCGVHVSGKGHGTCGTSLSVL